MLYDKDIIINKNELEKEIYKSLLSLRFKGINVVSQIRKIKMKYSYFINIGKIDLNYLKDKYGYDKNHLIKLINDLDFLRDSHLNNLYHFSEKGQDPFLVSLSLKMSNTNIISSVNSKETKNEIFSEFEDYDLNSKNDDDIEENSDKNIIKIKGKKYKVLPMTQEIWDIIKKLMYYLTQEILFNMVKLEKEEMNNLSTHHMNFENSSVNHNPFLIDKKSINQLKDSSSNNKEKMNPSKVIANLKLSDTNKYNQLFFNKTLANSKSNNEKRIIKRNEKMNIFLKLNRDIGLLDKKLRGEKIDDEDDNKNFADIYNILHKNPKNEEKKTLKKNETDMPKIGSNKTLKRLVIRTNTNDYFQEKKPEPKKKQKRTSEIVDEKMIAKQKREENILKEVEQRINIEIDKKIKSIEDSITKEMKQKMELNKKRLEEKTKLIEEEKKKLEKFLETQRNLRILEEERRAKIALERQEELEKEELKRKEKKKEMELMNQKMRKEIEDKIMNEIERRFKEQEEMNKIKELEEKKRREEIEKEFDLRMSEEKQKKEQVEKNMEELLERIRKEEIDRLKKDEINNIRDEEIERIMITKLDYLTADEFHEKKINKFTKDINKEIIKGQKLDNKINDPEKIKEIKDSIYKDLKQEYENKNQNEIINENKPEIKEAKEEEKQINNNINEENNNIEKNSSIIENNQNEIVNQLENSIKKDGSNKSGIKDDLEINYFLFN